MAGQGSGGIVITGVSRGLGRAMVDGFIERGLYVIGCSRSTQQVDALNRQYEGRADFAVVDVADDAGVADWAGRICERIGAPGLLLNNAALINRNRKLWEVTAEEFDRVIDVNIKGVANCVRHFVPSMVEQNRGVIVNFSSGWGRSSAAEVAPYCATKFAIEGLTQALARELPRGMAAVPLNPGVINTEMLQSCFGTMADHYPSADEWADSAVPFLLHLSSKHNGQSLTVPV